ncbi:MAG: TCR/Tet family MFS transporter [Myxococcota bacterium]
MAETTSPTGRAHRGVLAFLIFTVFIDAMGIGLIVPVFPQLLMELSGGGITGAAYWGGVATTIYAVMQFVFSPIVGALSDRFGRRPVLLVSLAAFSLDMVLLGSAWALWVFLLARTLSGVFAATVSTSNAYIADITPAEERARRYGLLGAAFGAGFVLGPALGGVLGELGTRTPFFAGAAFAALNCALGVAVLRESLPPERRRAFEWGRANPFGTLARLLASPRLGVLIAVYFFAALSTWVYPVIWSYVAVAKFDWSVAEIGASLAYYGVLSIISQGFLIGPVLERLSVVRALAIALCFEFVGLIGLGLAPTTPIFYGFLTLSLVTSLQEPALREILSAGVGDDEQGELQGGLASLGGIAAVAAPLLYTPVFHAFAERTEPIALAGAPFLVASVFSLAALALLGVHRSS